MTKDDFLKGKRFKVGKKELSFHSMFTKHYDGYIAHWFQNESGHEANV